MSSLVGRRSNQMPCSGDESKKASLRWLESCSRYWHSATLSLVDGHAMEPGLIGCSTTERRDRAPGPIELVDIYKKKQAEAV